MFLIIENILSLQFKVDNNASNGLVLSQSFRELLAHLPVDNHKALTKEFGEIIHDLSDVSLMIKLLYQ